MIYVLPFSDLIIEMFAGRILPYSSENDYRVTMLSKLCLALTGIISPCRKVTPFKNTK